MPGSEDDTDARHPRVLVLELWAAGCLACCHPALLFPTCCSGALAELRRCSADPVELAQGLGAPRQAAPGLPLAAESAAFLRDMERWLRFAASARAMQQHQDHPQVQGQGPPAGLWSSSACTDGTQLALMADVGRDLLDHSLCCGMLEVAGEWSVAYGIEKETRRRVSMQRLASREV